MNVAELKIAGDSPSKSRMEREKDTTMSDEDFNTPLLSREISSSSVQNNENGGQDEISLFRTYSTLPEAQCDEKTPSNPASPNATPNNAGTFRTWFTLFKAFCGAGVIYAPRSFALSGTAMGTLIYFVAGSLSVYSMLLLLATKHKLETHGHVITHYLDIARVSLSPAGFSCVSIALTMSQLGFGCVYFIYVGKYVTLLIQQFSHCRHSLDSWEPMLFALPLYMALVLIRRVEHFSLISMVGTVSTFVVAIYITVYDGIELSINGVADDWSNVGPVSGVLMTLGTACYSFEGTVMVLPVQASMKDPTYFPYLLVSVVFATFVFLAGVGNIHYLVNGSHTGLVAVENLPIDDLGSKVVTLQLVFLSFVSYPIVMFPPVAAVQAWAGFLPDKSGRKWSKNFLRIALVLFTFFVAATCADLLDYVLAIMGGVFCVPLALFFPVIMYGTVQGWSGAKTAAVAATAAAAAAAAAATERERGSTSSLEEDSRGGAAQAGGGGGEKDVEVVSETETGLTLLPPEQQQQQQQQRYQLLPVALLPSPSSVPSINGPAPDEGGWGGGGGGGGGGGR